ncbi:ATP-binding protein [Agromyces intestinalis]|uniref:histidine kinase n=1 Tax=Agromyces intestinalis TaxID=2592652 RepID=A0A5C1YEX9_9MICO|nr:ATP-binding protein [Agromyces intestinalis]QEO13577.1 ATP-binding protein [Agromyces intestinalis]
MPGADGRLTRPVDARRAVSGARVETVTGRALGAAAIVFSLQTVPAAISQSAALVQGASAALVAVMYGSAVALAVAMIARMAERITAVVYAAAYAVVLLAWPFLVEDPAALDGQAPWLYYLMTVATTAVVFSMPIGAAVGYTLVAPALFGMVRLQPQGGSADPLTAAFETGYSIILGMVVLVIVAMLRHAAEGVDSAQDAALARYDVAARQHANEIERVRTDALVHDSVLTTLLAAAAAETADEQQLAARMARDAVARLREAGTSTSAPDARIELNVLVRRLRAALTTFATPFTVRVVNAGGVELTVDAVEALYSAAVQAMVNSLQHADDGTRPTRRELRIRGVRAAGCVIEVADTGVGFDPAMVPTERLGLRVSIEERLAGAGGTATITSSPGHGTTVTLVWPEGVDRT